MSAKFGDIVIVHIPPCPPEEMVVSGTMQYSSANDCLLFCSDQAFGMPANAGWAKVIGHDRGVALKYRERYERQFPDALKPLEMQS